MTMKSLAACILFFGLFAGCGGNSTEPTPSVPLCQANNTANVSFSNRSANTTHDIVWDGLKLGTLAPGQTGLQTTVAASVAHRLEFRITNTTLFACATSNPIPIQCDTPVYPCAFP